MQISAKRRPENPLITFKSDNSLGNNINGPSVIKVPDWISNPLGSYYMYLSHHSGKYIRLAYADKPEGPWEIYQPGTLQLEDARSFKGHIASPDVHIDHKNKKIIMYFHGISTVKDCQWTGIAFSEDAINFQSDKEQLGNFYFRVFKYKNNFYAIAKDDNSGWGELYRLADGRSNFKSLGKFLKNVRHTAVLVEDDILFVFYSRKGDAPERIICSRIKLDDDYSKWVIPEPVDVLKPELDYEGIEYDNIPSEYGSAIKVQQLRDPCIFLDNNKTYLYYTYGGEMGIALAELTIN